MMTLDDLTPEELADFMKRRRMAAEFREQYDAAHKYCPSCGGSSVGPDNYMGSNILVINEDGPDLSYQDKSNYSCICGWSGIKHEMTGINPIVDFTDPNLKVYGNKSDG